MNYSEWEKFSQILCSLAKRINPQLGYCTDINWLILENTSDPNLFSISYTCKICMRIGIVDTRSHGMEHLKEYNLIALL